MMTLDTSRYTLYYLMIVVLSFGLGVPVIVYLAALGKALTDRINGKNHATKITHLEEI